MALMPAYYTTTRLSRRKKKKSNKQLAAEAEHEKFLKKLFRDRGVAQPGSASALTNTLKNHPLINRNSLMEDEMRYSKIKCNKCDREIGSNNWNQHDKICEGKKPCPICSKLFVGTSATCSYSCSNKYHRTGPNNGNWKDARYSTTCFHYHEKKCVICGENKIVGVHHLNENHNDNRPENLIPLCPTHHQYFHSRYRDEVESIINEYITKWKRTQVPPTSDVIPGVCPKREHKIYTGDKLLGIATMHKSNMVPVFSKQEAEDISRMRRG